MHPSPSVLQVAIFSTGQYYNQWQYTANSHTMVWYCVRAALRCLASVSGQFAVHCVTSLLPLLPGGPGGPREPVLPRGPSSPFKPETHTGSSKPTEEVLLYNVKVPNKNKKLHFTFRLTNVGATNIRFNSRTNVYLPEVILFSVSNSAEAAEVFSDNHGH